MCINKNADKDKKLLIDKEINTKAEKLYFSSSIVLSNGQHRIKLPDFCYKWVLHIDAACLKQFKIFCFKI